MDEKQLTAENNTNTSAEETAETSISSTEAVNAANAEVATKAEVEQSETPQADETQTEQSEAESATSESTDSAEANAEEQPTVDNAETNAEEQPTVDSAETNAEEQPTVDSAEANAEEQPTEEPKELTPLEQVNAELADLLPQGEEVNTDKAYVPDNVDDSAEIADEIGISGIFDEYNREILEPVFENRLRMSVNSIKLTYSKVKNTILSYKGMTQRYEKDHELFKNESKTLFRAEIGADSLILYLKLEKEIDKEEFCVEISEEDAYSATPVKLLIKRGTEVQNAITIDKALSLIALVMEENGITKRKVYVPIAYAQRYPINPDAVLRGQEKRAPENGQYDSEEYDPIEGELTRNIVDELLGKDFNVDKKKGKAKLEALRQQATTIKASVALTEPIVYFYENALNRDNTSAYINIQQVLNDKFLGKILPQQYFAIAEGSDRIEQLNLYALQEAAQTCNDNPKITFVIQMSCRMLSRKQAFNKMLKLCAVENNNLVIAFDAVMLETLGKLGMDGIDALRDNGVKIMIDGTENVGLHMLTDYAVDYLRFDSRYYVEDNLRRTALLDMMTGYANVQGILTTAAYVDSTKEAKHLLSHGVNIIQGFAVSEPKRAIHNAIKEIKKLPIVQ